MVFSGSKRENSLLYVSKETNAFCDVDYLDITFKMRLYKSRGWRAYKTSQPRGLTLG